VLDIFRSEIDRVMGLCGVRNLDEIGPALLMRPSYGGPVPSTARSVSSPLAKTSKVIA
jgi:hypothetical protein